MTLNAILRAPIAPRAPAPVSGYQPVSVEILGAVGVLPCDVFLVHGGRAVLYAARGSDALDVLQRADAGVALCIHGEDSELLRRGLSKAVSRILADQSLPPVERSRRAYGVMTYVMGPILSHESQVDRGGLDDASVAVDALMGGLTTGNDLVWSMVSTMNRHLSTHTHAINTAVYAVLAAQALGYGPDEIRDIGRGALLHDIGKNRVPPAILDKPGPLDEAEWVTVRSHPQIGFDIVVRAMGAEPSYAKIIAEHHERADGSGYPHKRLGKEVGKPSRLVAIVDAYDALTSARSYKGAMSSYGALWTMRFQMRGQFDARLLSAFVGVLGGWEKLKKADLRNLELPPPEA